MWICATPSAAGELDGYDGRLRSNTSGDTTYTWGLEYREALSDHFLTTFTWLNEGHLPTNHRDGQAVQLLWRSTPGEQGLVFEAGLGPYRYYDTHLLDENSEFQNKHGWGGLGSAAVGWYFQSHWFTFLRLNEAIITDKYGSTAVALGAGYAFSTKNLVASGLSLGADTAAQRWEIDALIGERIGNTQHSEAGASEGVGARVRLSDHFTASLTYIAGQGTLLDWRDGIAFQLWLEQRLTSHLEVGVGAGGFLVSSDDSLKDASTPSNLAAMVSVTVGYALSPSWIVRVIWDRIGTGDDHDADIVHFAAGYRF